LPDLVSFIDNKNFPFNFTNTEKEATTKAAEKIKTRILSKREKS
jgi:hypothetical protein